MVTSWAAFAASVLLRPHRGQFNAWLDAGLYDIPFCFVAVACLVRAAKDEAERLAWRSLGIGFGIFAIANLYGSLIIGDQEIYPSPADAGWLSFYVLVYVAMVQLIASRLTRFRPSEWLDGVVGGLGAAALVAALALGPALTLTEGKLSTVATNLAYPTAEIVLIIILVASGQILHARDASFWLLAAGLLVLCATDVTYLFQEAAGTYAEGGLLDVFWPLAAVLMGGASFVKRGVRAPLVETRQRLFIPAIFTATSVALLAYGQRHQISVVAIALAITALGAAAIRVTLTVREVKALAESRREARTDELTGLPNRRLLIEQLSIAVRESGTAAALLIVDLDGFKEVNDSLGHVEGDRLLHAVGQRFAQALPPNTLLGRLGGDEFALVLPASSAEEALGVAGLLREALRDPFSVHEVQVTVDTSIGIACSPEHGTTSEHLLSRADVAMFRAKRQRTGVETFDSNHDTTSTDRLQLIADLRAAFDEQQFTLRYQPQLDIRTGEICGVEALVRWDHPNRGLISPGVFLPLLEQVGLMTRLSVFVLRQALGDCSIMCRSGFPVRMSVNISASDLIGDGLADLISQLLLEHHLNPGDILIEVTEDTVMSDRVRSLSMLHRIRASGVHISIDDYGTGQASLSYVRDLPISQLKLDRSFLQGIPADTHNAAIVRSTIELAHALDLPIVAEGVEDAAALVWLRHLGCDIVQGFHISRPLTLSQLGSWLQAREAGEQASRHIGVG
jgi:diguanylate cyclase